MSRELNSVQKSSDVPLGRSCNVVVQAIQESFTKKEKQKERAVRYNIVSLFRKAEITEHVASKQVLCLERCREVTVPRCLNPRSTLAGFANTRHRQNSWRQPIEQK